MSHNLSISDHSKGYGFVEFQHNKEKSNQARMCLDGRKVGTCVLHCDFLEPDVVSFEDLHSRCLFIDHLPPSFDDAAELRDIFSRVVEPQYFEVFLECHVAIAICKKGKNFTVYSNSLWCCVLRVV